MSLAVEAEQALLGAVLADPPGSQHVLDLVEPSDMRRPWHGQVLAAMRRVRGRGQLPSPELVYAELQHDPDLPRSVALDAVPLAGLIGACPRPAHAGAYAAIVAETGIRRRVGLAASRLAQAAGTGDLDAALTQAAHVRAVLTGSAARWTALVSRLRGERASGPGLGLAGAAAAPQPAVVPGTSSLPGNERPGDQQAPTAGRAGGAVSRPGFTDGRPALGPAGETRLLADRAGAAASVRALRDLIDDPSRLAEVRAWLRPEHFPRAGHGRLYALLLEMDAAGQPVDPVTVARAAAGRGLRTGPARLAGGTGPFAVASAREVRRIGLLAQLAAAGNSIGREAADARGEPFGLIEGAVRRLEPFRNEPLAQSAPERGTAPGCRVPGARPAEPEAAR